MENRANRETAKMALFSFFHLLVSFSSFVVSRKMVVAAIITPPPVRRRPHLFSSSNCLRTANELGRGETVETRGHIALQDLQAGYSQCAEILTDSGNESEAAGMEKFITLPPRCTMCPKVQRSVRQPILYPPCSTSRCPILCFERSVRPAAAAIG